MLISLLGLVVCAQMREKLEKLRILQVREQSERVIHAEKHRQERTGFVFTFPGNMSMLPFAWHISLDKYLYEKDRMSCFNESWVTPTL